MSAKTKHCQCGSLIHRNERICFCYCPTIKDKTICRIVACNMSADNKTDCICKHHRTKLNNFGGDFYRWLDTLDE